ncbi:MAG: hypothetical protein VKP72_10215 [bacterium]|nr:hypothetical protein [bacterium]
MKHAGPAFVALVVAGLSVLAPVTPATAAPMSLDARFQAQFQEAYRMLYRGAETGDSELMARGQEKIQGLVAQLEAALRAHPRDAKLKDLLRSVVKGNGSTPSLEEASLDDLEKQLSLP